jgi:transcriptional regulator with XRE-family HTH domain
VVAAILRAMTLSSAAPTKTRLKLAENVRRLRQLRNWTQETLAERCGLHHTYIGGIERGERNLGVDNIERLARALGVKPGDLLS